MHILGFIKEVALPKKFVSFCDLEMLIAWTCLFFLIIFVLICFWVGMERLIGGFCSLFV